MFYSVPGDPNFDKVVCLHPWTEYFSDWYIYDKAYGIGFYVSYFISSTAQSKWGTRSIIYSDSYTLFRAFNSSLYSLGTEDFTVEVWVYVLGPHGFIVRAGGFDFGINADTTLWCNSITASVPLPTGEWVHVAATRESGTMRLWQNGVKVGEATVTTSFYTSGEMNIFSWQFGGGALNAYGNDFRMTKGLARYSTDFSVPSEPFAWREENYPVQSPILPVHQTHTMARTGW